jgi:DNA-binding transcriptional ArsR family regulator
MLEDKYDIFFNTLSNRRRLRILEYLMDEEANVSQITSDLDMNQSTVSQNLKRLESCGFVNRRKDGKKRVYSLNEDTIEPLLDLIEEHVDKYCSNLCGNCEN